MMEPAYPAARTVAPAVASRFARLHESAVREGEQDRAPLPDVDAIQALIDAAFWASLRHEEGRVPRMSLAFVPPERTRRPLTFDRRIPFAPAAIARLAPAVGRPGVHLGVWPDGGALAVWGATRSIPPHCFVLEVVRPALLVVKHRRADPSAKYGNVAVLDGDRVTVVDERALSLPEYLALVTSIAGTDPPHPDGGSAEVLVRLALSMRAHGQGGALLVVPDGTEAWRASIVDPPLYPVVPSFSLLAELKDVEPPTWSPLPWHEAFRRAVDGVAGLTAIDGAAVMTDRHQLLAFGARIERAPGRRPVEEVVVTEPVVGNAAAVRPLSALGGMRHSSAAQFVHDQRDALALVASQDGRFTVFAWSPAEGRVGAHRVEALLL